MKHLLMLLAVSAMINKNQTAAQAPGKLAMNSVITAIYTSARDNHNSPGDNIENISVKAVNNFKHRYKAVSNVKWMLLSDGYLASFSDGNILNRVFYYPNGNLAGTIKGYEPALLPKEILQTVKEKYAGYKVVYVNEAELLEIQGSPTYVVQLQGKKDFKVVRVCDDEVDELNDYSKEIKYPARF
jgi:hypothetical protein